MSDLAKFVNEALPAVSGSHLSYNPDRNMFLTDGYTSGMGHTYYQGIQISERVAVVYDIGRGGWGCNPLFLNGVKVYCFDGREKKLIGSWNPSCYCFYGDDTALRIATELLYNYLESQVKMTGASLTSRELREFATAQIKAAATHRPALSA